MSANKLPEADLQYKYQPRLELSFVLSLALITLVFYSFRGHGSEPLPIMDIPDHTIIVEYIPPTIHPKKQLKPSRPVIDLEADEDEDFTDYEVLNEIFDPDMSMDIAPPDEDEEIPYWATSEKPILIHQETPYYPELAQKVGIEGRVIVEVLISKKGRVLRATLVGEENMLSEAALAAAWKCIFKPAKQRDKFVRVKMTIPFEFKLR